MGNQSTHHSDATDLNHAKAGGVESHVHAFHLELPWHHVPHSTKGGFDAGKSLSQLMSEGKMKDARAHGDNHAASGKHGLAGSSAEVKLALTGSDRGQQHADFHATGSGAIPKVKVVFEQESHDPRKPAREPDFVINKKGKIEVRNDCEKNPNPDGQIVVRVARERNQMDPTKAEVASLDHLVTYLDGRVRHAHPELKQQKLDVADDQGLIDERVKHQVARPSTWHMPDQTRHEVERMNRFQGGEGTLSHHQLNNYFPRRDVPQARNESPGVVALKDAVASLFSPDTNKPYSTVRERPDGGFAVGRYGLNDNLISSWFFDVLGNPPDWSKVDELVAEGKIPKELGKQLHDPKFRQGFGQFLEQMKGGHGAVTSAEVDKFLSKETQETIASDTVKRFAAGGERDPGKIALGMALGRSPDQLTPDVLNADGSRQYMGAADRLFGLAQARQMTGKDDRIEWSGTSPMGARIAQVAENTAHSMGSIGWCARGVETALGKLGIHFSGNAADTRNFFEHDGRFQRVAMNDLQPGDVVVRGASSSHQYGHIFVYLGNDREASDHVQSLTNGSNYGQSVAFRFVGDNNSRNA